MTIDKQRLLEQADVAARRGDLSGAAALYRQVIALAPDDAIVLQRLADALARTDQHEDARGAFRQLAAAYRKQGHQMRRSRHSGGQPESTIRPRSCTRSSVSCVSSWESLRMHASRS
ncbi:MAG: tetratricopeptide repeat protein [Acidobacteria bacterium]|nr:tetratricopeptide repeat protein [Acidobacteriota bacterium]